MKKIQLTLLSLIWIWIVIILFSSCSSIDPATRTANYQEPREYAYWERSQMTVWQKVFGKKSKDPRIIQAEVEVKQAKWLAEQEKKEQKILKEVEAIKSKIK